MADNTCAVPTCDRVLLAKGLCSAHYQRNKTHGTPEPAHLPPIPPSRHGRCVVPDCDRQASDNSENMCRMHLGRLRRRGDPNYVYVRTKSAGVDTCSIDGCESLVKVRGWCAMHWKRFYVNGDPLKTRLTDRICVTCGASYQGRGRTMACSLECSQEYARRRNRLNVKARRAVTPDRPPVERHVESCMYCGGEFMADKRKSCYCSPECLAANKNVINRPNLAKRRRRLADAHVETFTREEIFERDGWVCQICHEPVDREVKWPDPFSVSIDHIIPLVRNSEHSRANVQTTHTICNAHKGAKLMA